MVFFGHIIFANGIYVDPQKVETVLNLERHTSVTKVRSFLGLVSYYRHFIKDFSNIATPLHYLTRKRVKVEWDDKCKKSFQELK